MQLWRMQEARCVFAIHNLSHQGVEPAATFPNLGLPDDWCVSGSALHGMTGRAAALNRSAAFALVRLTEIIGCPLVRMAGLQGLPHVLFSRRLTGTLMVLGFVLGFHGSYEVLH